MIITEYIEVLPWNWHLRNILGTADDDFTNKHACTCRCMTNNINTPESDQDSTTTLKATILYRFRLSNACQRLSCRLSCRLSESVFISILSSWTYTLSKMNVVAPNPIPNATDARFKASAPNLHQSLRKHTEGTEKQVREILGHHSIIQEELLLFHRIFALLEKSHQLLFCCITTEL